MSDYDLGDIQNDKTFTGAQTKDTLRTSFSQETEPRLSMTSYDLSATMQGYALYVPPGLTYDVFNQELSGELENLGVEQLFKIRDDKLTPYDVFIKDPDPRTAGSVTAGSATTGESASGNSTASAGALTSGTNQSFVIGDSITVGCKAPLEANDKGWEFTIDAKRSRPPSAGLSILRARNGDFGTALVVNLGTNPENGDPAKWIGEVMQLAVSTKRVCFVTCVEHHDYPKRVNAEIMSLKNRDDKVVVTDWASHVRTNPGWLAGDGMHCTGEGYKQLANMITTTLGKAPSAAGGGIAVGIKSALGG